jgi:hypothetical protein
MAHHFYVYYRVRPDAMKAAGASVVQLLAAIERATGVRGRRLARCDEPALWMEIYEGVADRAAFEAVLAEAARAANLEAHLGSGSARTVECFRD